MSFFFIILQTQVAVDQLFSDDYEVTSVGPGENVKIKLKVSVAIILNLIIHFILIFKRISCRASRRRMSRLVLCSVMPQIPLKQEKSLMLRS